MFIVLGFDYLPLFLLFAQLFGFFVLFFVFCRVYNAFLSLFLRERAVSLPLKHFQSIFLVPFEGAHVQSTWRVVLWRVDSLVALPLFWSAPLALSTLASLAPVGLAQKGPCTGSDR